MRRPRAGIHAALSQLLLAVQAGLAVPMAYLAVVTVGAWRAAWKGRTRTAVDSTAHHRFLVLVPAHDEERLIASTVRSMMRLDYPHDMYEVHVVADNCTDATAELARQEGAVVHERDDPMHRGKGPALMWLLGRLWTTGVAHDAIVIVDADSTLSENFLRVLDAHMAAGDRVIQAYYAVRDPGRSWSTGLRFAGLAVRHYLRPLGRTELGGSCGLYGNGMCFHADVMRARRWTSHLTEDVELHMELLLDGQPVAFAPDAVVEAEMPTTLAASRTQHERWERGRLELARHYVPRLLQAPRVAQRHQRRAQVDAALDHLVPPFSVLVAASVLAGLAGQTLVLLRRTRLSRLNARVGMVLAGIQALYVLSGLRLVRAPRSVYLALVRAPALVIWKVRLWLRVLSGRHQVEWLRTVRNPDPSVQREGRT